MKLPLEISYRGVQKTPAIEQLIRDKVDDLEQVCDYLNSCRIAVERLGENPTRYHTRIEMTLPPGKDLAISRDPGEVDQTDVEAVIRNAFAAARRLLRRTVEKQHGETKEHPKQQVIGIIDRLLPKDGYGFIRALEGGYEVYFHRNSVLNEDFENLEVGAGVTFSESKGDKGPQASTVRVLEQPPHVAGT